MRRVKIDVSEQNGEFKVLAELPGVKKEDIRVNIEGDQVSIAAETRAEREVKEDQRVLHTERYFGKVASRFPPWPGHRRDARQREVQRRRAGVDAAEKGKRRDAADHHSVIG